MRSMKLRHTLGGASQTYTLLPHGCRFGAVSGTNALDAFAGSLLLTGLEVQASPVTPNIGAASNILISAQGYDLMQNSSGSLPGRPVIGGTTTSDAYRVAVGSSATVQVDDWGQPYILNTPNSQITNSRLHFDVLAPVKIWDRWDLPGDPIEFQFGCALVISISGAQTNDVISIVATYEPHVSGGTRKRQRYDPNMLYHGTSTGTNASPATMTDSAQTWIPNSLIGGTVYTNGKTGVIVSNTATVITVSSWVGGTPASANAYFIQPLSRLFMQGNPSL